MNEIKPLAETENTVTLRRADWTAMLAALDEASDRAAIAARRAREAGMGRDAARRDYLSGEEARRLLDGEHPLKLWREKRGLTQRELAEAAQVSPSYLAEIEREAKPGSMDALAKLGAVLGVSPADLDVALARRRDPAFGPAFLRYASAEGGLGRGSRGAPIESVRFRNVEAALDHVRRDWARLRYHPPFLVDEGRRPIYGIEELYELMEPETIAALQRQARR